MFQKLLCLSGRHKWQSWKADESGTLVRLCAYNPSHKQFGEMIICDACDGTGKERYQETKHEMCDACGGTGDDGNFAYTGSYTCQSCGGQGSVEVSGEWKYSDSVKCYRCNGTGEKFRLIE